MNSDTDQTFLRNEVLARDDQTMHRLLRLDLQLVDDSSEEQSLNGSAWLLPLGASLALPYKVEYADLQAQYDKLPAREVAPAPVKTDLLIAEMSTLLMPPSQASLALSDRACRRIESLVDNPDIHDPRKRLAACRALEGVQQGTPKTLFKDLRHWWQGGQTLGTLTASNGSPLPGRLRSVRRA